MKERLILGLIFTFVILIFLLSIMNGSIYLNSEDVFLTIPNHILIIGVSFFIVSGLVIVGFLVRSLLHLIQKEAEFDAQAAYVESMDELFRSLKSQRHDFNNHVQALYGMIKENMIDLAKEYITEVFKETRELNDVITVDRPEIASLLKAKQTSAIQNRIVLSISISCKLSPIPLKPHKLVRVCGNIIDNAFDATLSAPENNKKVEFNVYSEGNKIYLETINSGILPENISELFSPGISNKDSHTGLGLYIVKELVENHDGSVTLENLNGKVVCRVIFDKIL
ncbi:sensor histidine kinase [Desulfotomaculum sp. 1211_IL3151]|uniref:sensor histidine kinase n=1 Tax=Desulfotomaculum sp. 1211_IL3151 TaxID=3084055 RepID=UPI002FDABE5E